MAAVGGGAAEGAAIGNNKREFDVVVFGATGFTGKLAWLASYPAR